VKLSILAGLAIFSTLKHVAKFHNTISLSAGYPCEFYPHFRTVLSKTVQLLPWGDTEIFKGKYFCVGTNRFLS
jgi:hypothetical protein